MDLLGGSSFNLIDWTAETILAFVVLLILTDRIVTKGRLTDEKAEKEVWRIKSQTETEINRKNAETIANYAQAELLAQKFALWEQRKLDSQLDPRDRLEGPGNQNHHEEKTE